MAIATITPRGRDRTSLVRALVSTSPDEAIARLHLPVRPRQQADDARTGGESHRECKEEEGHFHGESQGSGRRSRAPRPPTEAVVAPQVTRAAGWARRRRGETARQPADSRARKLRMDGWGSRRCRSAASTRSGSSAQTAATVSARRPTGSDRWPTVGSRTNLTGRPTVITWPASLLVLGPGTRRMGLSDRAS